MKLSPLATVFSALCVSVHAHPVTNNAPTLDQRQSDVVVTTGAGGSTIYPRLEIRQMKNQQPNQYTLLVLALQQWKAQAQSSPTSYFGVSTIHGVPRQDYNGVAQCSGCGGSDGYCPHNSILFPAWHRAYMALFEQEFLQVVQTVANSYPASQQQTMVNAANQMRWPYWDWAAHAPNGDPTLPTLVTDNTVTVNGPSGSVTIDNPLYRYDFTDSSGLYYYPFTTWTTTYRYPTANDASAVSNTQAAVSAVDNVRQNLQEQVYSLFTNCKDYTHFSNDDAGSSSTSCSNSLEGIHNTIHQVTGGGPNGSVSGGHMYYLPTSSFDPVFWLHHCNVDRIFAMWQRLNPSSYGGSQVAPQNTWTVQQGTTQDQDSPLTPFYKNTNGQFYSTNDVQDWTQFKYTYPEFADSDGSAASITTYVNNLYGPNANAYVGSSKRDLVDTMTQAVGDLAHSLAGNPLAALNGSLYQYAANIKAPRYALNGTYQIFVFNGDPASEDPSTWITDENLIGPMGVLAHGGMSDNDVLTSGSVPLTRTLTKMVGSGLLSGLTEAIVVPFLTANLKWRVQGPNGEEVDPANIPGFVVSVVTSTASVPGSSTLLPTFSDFFELPDVTDGKAGGSNCTGSS